MISEFNKRKLRFVVLPTRLYPASKKKDSHEAYACWKRVWGQAFSEEMNVKDTLYSDYYLKQSHVAALFHGDIAVGLTTLNFLELDDQKYLDDSFFKVWPEDAIHKVKTEFHSILACCNVTLDFKFRQHALGISAKDLLLAMQLHYLKATQHDAIVSAVRLEKGMEKASYRTGAYALAKGLPYTIAGQMVDIVCWTKNLNLDCLQPEIKELAQYLWLNSSEIIDLNYYQGEKHVG
jgi:hypothetical protein